jgi:hypothetical protein
VAQKDPAKDSKNWVEFTAPRGERGPPGSPGTNQETSYNGIKGMYTQIAQMKSNITKLESDMTKMKDAVGQGDDEERKICPTLDKKLFEDFTKVKNSFCGDYALDLVDEKIINVALIHAESLLTDSRRKGGMKFVEALPQFARYSIVDRCSSPLFQARDISIQYIDQGTFVRKKEWAFIINLDKSSPHGSS